MELTIDNASAHYYAFFYIIAFITGFVILIIEGRKRNLPQLPWLLVITSGFIFFVLGCRIVTLTREDWMAILHNRPIDHATGLVMLGGLLFGLPAIILTKRLVALKAQALDAYAYVLPVGMFLERIGCFLNGCCFGTTTASKIGVHYAGEAIPYKLQYINGVIPSTAIHSLALHPVQLYESAGCFLAILLIWYLRRKIITHGALFYISGLLYYIIRFFSEFFRDPRAHAIDTPVFYYLNTVQWSMVLMIIGSFLIIYFNKKITSRRPLTEQSPASLVGCCFMFLSLTIVFLMASKWLSIAEMVVVYIVIFTTGAFMVYGIFKSMTVPRFRLASLGLMCLGFIMMSQTYPEKAKSDSTKISYNTISIGGLAGSQNFSITAEDCSGNTISELKYLNKYKLGALGVSRTVQTTKDNSMTIGISAYTGTHTETLGGDFADDIDARVLQSYGVNPYGQLDYRLFAIGIGLHVGDMAFIHADPTATSLKRYRLYPQAYMRFGNIDRVFGEISLARNFPSSFPGNVFLTSIGFGLDHEKLNGGVIKIGTSSASGLFVSSSFPIGQHYVLEPYVGILGSPLMISQGYDKNEAYIGSISLHYKFNKRTRSE